jgi:hypothetical protein
MLVALVFCVEFLVGSVLLIVLVFCVVFFCFVCLRLVSLGCLFLIVPSVFSKVY